MPTKPYTDTLFDGMDITAMPRTNLLLYGDNLDIMRTMKLSSVDLIYLDPPFKSDTTYNLIYKNLTGRPIPEQVSAFSDTWEYDEEKQKLATAVPRLLEQHNASPYLVKFWEVWIKALSDTQPHLLAYLLYMVERLLEMHTILKPTGSIYLHCDPTASHYIKVMMDGIFGHTNFRNEIVWKRTYAHGGASRWGDIHDTILFYTKSDAYTWNRDVKQAHDPEYVDDKYRNVDNRGQYQLVVMTGPGITEGASGQPWRGYDPTRIGRHWAVPRRALQMLEAQGVEIPDGLHDRLELLYEHGVIQFTSRGGNDGSPRFKLYLTEGQPVQDMILDIPPINSQAKDRLGYPTQKPVALLERIVRVSSKPGDVVFDPFCGCGTTIYAAHEAGRHWIGCDIAILAVRLVEDQLLTRYGLVKGEHYKERGIPNSVDAATALFAQNPFQFEHWAVEHVDGFPTKKTADKGIDGRMYFEMGGDELGVMVLSVKGGAIKPGDVRDLTGVLSVEPDAYLAGLVTLREPTKGMRKAAAAAGVWEYQGMTYHRVQILSVREILEDGKRFLSPAKIRSRKTPDQTMLAV